MERNVTVSPNAVAFKGKSINRTEIYSVDYSEPKGVFMAVVSNVAKYLVFMLFVIGIPFCIAAIVRDVKKHRVVVTLKEYDKNNKRKTKEWYMEKEDYDYLRSNY